VAIFDDLLMTNHVTVGDKARRLKQMQGRGGSE
jgi:hypothetical protein